jgi:hypothetical protein
MATKHVSIVHRGYSALPIYSQFHPVTRCYCLSGRQNGWVAECYDFYQFAGLYQASGTFGRPRQGQHASVEADWLPCSCGWELTRGTHNTRDD